MSMHARVEVTFHPGEVACESIRLFRILFYLRLLSQANSEATIAVIGQAQVFFWLEFL